MNICPKGITEIAYTHSEYCHGCMETCPFARYTAARVEPSSRSEYNYSKKIGKNALEDFIQLYDKINEIVMELGEFFMKLHGLSEDDYYVEPNSKFNGFQIMYHDEDEEKDSFYFLVSELIDIEGLKKRMIHSKQRQEEYEIKQKAEEAKRSEERDLKEFIRLKSKFEGNNAPKND